MTTNALLTRRLIGIFLLACVLLSYPVMTVFNVRAMVFGIPLLYVYIFTSWVVIIFLIFLVSISPTPKRHQGASDSLFLRDSDS